MRVAITGSTGLIGSALTGALAGAGHEPVPVVRRGASAGEIAWDPAGGSIDAAAFEGIDAVVHLAAAGIGDARLTEERKELLLESRTRPTDLLASALADLSRPPRVLLSASAIGIYGDRGDEVLTEESALGHDFLAQVCAAWEAATAPAEAAGIRTAHLRTGLVQSRDGGALGKTLLPFKIGLGGRLGSGQQWWSWISIDDEVRAILHLLEADVSGPVNLTGPEPVRNRDYTKTLGRELGRPTVLPTPKFAPALVLGRELARLLLYQSQRVEPRVLLRSGFEFRHPTLEDALAAVLGDQEL